MKVYIIIRDVERIKTMQGTHARVFLNEADARNYYNSCPDNEQKKFAIVEIP